MDLDLDNTRLFRYHVEKEGSKPRWNTKPNLDITLYVFCFRAPVVSAPK